MVDERSCLIRYGVMSHVGRFSATRVRDAVLERGQLVVIQTDRGLELGEVLAVLEGQASPAQPEPNGRISPGIGENLEPEHAVQAPHVVRLASPDDIARSLGSAEIRSSRFALCERILREGNWPWPLIDIEPLLDAQATVLHYLGPHHIDVAPLRARIRVECDFDVIFEAVGSEPDEGPISDGDAHEHPTAGGCGSCDCSPGGGCGSATSAATAGHHDSDKPAASGCSDKSHSGCSSCGISRMKAEWSRTRA